METRFFKCHNMPETIYNIESLNFYIFMRDKPLRKELLPTMHESKTERKLA